MSTWSYSDSLIHVCPHVFACMHTHTWSAYVSDVWGFCVGTRVSWQVDSWLSTCTGILTYMCTCVHMCGVFAGYCVHSCVLTNDTCMSRCVCLHVHICTLCAYVRRESGLCVYTFVFSTKNSETVAWMSLYALHALFIDVSWITWLCTTQTYVGFACVLCAWCTYTSLCLIHPIYYTLKTQKCVPIHFCCSHPLVPSPFLSPCIRQLAYMHAYVCVCVCVFVHICVHYWQDWVSLRGRNMDGNPSYGSVTCVYCFPALRPRKISRTGLAFVGVYACVYTRMYMHRSFVCVFVGVDTWILRVWKVGIERWYSRYGYRYIQLQTKCVRGGVWCGWWDGLCICSRVGYSRHSHLCVLARLLSFLVRVNQHTE